MEKNQEVKSQWKEIPGMRGLSIYHSRLVAAVHGGCVSRYTATSDSVAWFRRERQEPLPNREVIRPGRL